MGIERRARLCIFIALLCPTFRCTSAAPASSPSTQPIPNGIGVNIHFTDPRPGELEMLAAAGFKWVRMDLGWGGMERRKGEYDFAAYDRLTAALDKHGLKALFILDYSNRLYDDGHGGGTGRSRPRSRPVTLPCSGPGPLPATPTPPGERATGAPVGRRPRCRPAQLPTAGSGADAIHGAAGGLRSD